MSSQVLKLSLFSFSKISKLFLNHQFQRTQKNAVKFISFKSFGYVKYYSSAATPDAIPDKDSPEMPEKNHSSPEHDSLNSVNVEQKNDAGASVENPDFKGGRNPFRNIEQDVQNKDPEVSHFIDDIAPPLPVSFNLAAYANRSPTLQKFIELNVDLAKLEQKPEYAKFIMQLDFERDVKPYIQFLHDKGVPASELGHFFSKNPLVFKHDLENLQIRIDYLESKNFNHAAIVRILCRNPFFLSMSTKSVDQRLGFLQKTFNLTGDEVRFVITKHPQLISYEHEKLLEKLFVFKAEMGFTESQMKQLLLMKPKVWLLGRKSLTERFNIVCGLMGISHERILTFPGILQKRGFLLEQRHKYLEKLGRAQYDTTKPGYIPLHDIATTTDYAFCTKCAKTSVAEYNDFLKTL